MGRLGRVPPAPGGRRASPIVAAYDAEVAAYLNHIAGTRFPEPPDASSLEKQRDLPYGENPHQRAAFYRETTHRAGHARRRDPAAGRHPTFNDLLDLDAAYRIATDFTSPPCCIVKQGNPIGLASNDRWPRPTSGRSRAIR